MDSNESSTENAENAENTDHATDSAPESVDEIAVNEEITIADLSSNESEAPSSRNRLVAIIAGVVVVAVAVGLTLAVTVFKSPAVEAHVGKDVVTVKDVTNSVNEILAERKGVDTTGMQIATGAQLSLAELNFHLISYLLADTAAANNIKITDGDVTGRKAAIISQVGSPSKLPQALVAANIASEDLDLYIRSLLYDEQLATLLETSGVSQANAGTALEQEVAAEAAKVGVKVNSKYGTWDSTQAIVAAPAAAPAK